MKLAVTGHRPKDLGDDYEDHISNWFHGQFADMRKHVDGVYIGMAQGVDIIAGEAAIDEGIKVHAAVPFDGHCPREPERMARYMALVNRASTVTVVSPGPYAIWKLHTRNKFMVDRAELVLAVWNGKKNGGTWNCVDYAMKKEVGIIRYNPITREGGHVSQVSQ